MTKIVHVKKIVEESMKNKENQCGDPSCCIAVYWAYVLALDYNQINFENLLTENVEVCDSPSQKAA